MLSAFVIAAMAATGSWENTTNRDPIDDHTTVAARVLVGTGPLDAAQFVVRCDRDAQRFEVAVVTTRFQNSDSVAVEFRFDTDPAESGVWLPSTTGAGAFAPTETARRIADRLRTALKFVVRLRDYRGTPWTLEFPMQGAAAAIAQVRQACPALDPAVAAEQARAARDAAAKRAATAREAARKAREKATAASRSRWAADAMALSGQSLSNARQILRWYGRWNGADSGAPDEGFAASAADFAVASLAACSNPERAPDGYVCDSAPADLSVLDVLRAMCPGQLGPQVCGASRRNRVKPIT